MADHVVLMRSGRIEQDGTPVDLYEHPASTFVARFIGTPPMNLLKLVPGRDGAVIEGSDGPAVLDGSCAGGTLGLRPEHITLTFEKGLRTAVEAVEYLGGDSLVACRVGPQTISVRTPGSVGLSRGDATWLTWASGAEHYFAPDGRHVQPASRRQGVTQLA